jgi:hypothetical protein
MHHRGLLIFLALAGCSNAPVMEPELPVGRPPPKTPPANAVGGFSIDVPPVTLAPGDEQTPCFIFPLEVTGPSRMVGGGALSVGAGLHHGNIVTRKKTGEGMRKCKPGESSAFDQFIDVAGGGAVLFGSSTQVSGQEWQSFPAGNAYRIKDGYEIVARMHYINASAASLTVTPRYQWYTVDESQVVHELAPFLWDYDEFEIPPGQELTVRGECGFVEPMHVVSVLPHMHALGTGYRAGFIGGAHDGKLWLDSPGYDPENGVLLQFDPPVDLSQGWGSFFECTWKNTFDKVIKYGLGDDEMCMMFGYAWPPEAAYSVRANQKSCVVFGASD